MVAVFPTLHRKDMIPHALAPWERKTNKIKMEDERIKPEKVKNTKFGLFYSRIYRNSKITPNSSVWLDFYLKMGQFKSDSPALLPYSFQDVHYANKSL